MRGIRHRRGGGQRWATFLRNHAGRMWVCDFVQTHDLLFRQVYAFFFVHLASRHVVYVAATRHPTQAWTAQQLRNATLDGDVEWAGGYPALLRMTRIFYGKYVPQDPLIGPLFASMSPDHPERVAAWLSEVFGGPKFYSERHGGYNRMISQHINKGLTEAQRARWASLMGQSAGDAGLPNDAEFRGVLGIYRVGFAARGGELSVGREAAPQHADAAMVVGL